MLNDIEINKTNGRNKITRLPDGITIDMIPKYCYYKKPYNNRGGKFCIDKRHPQIGGKEWSTTSSKKVSIRDKYKQFMDKLETL